MLSLVFAFLFFAAMYTHHFIYAFIFLCGSATDALDGAVARYTKKTSLLGALLDSTVDRVADATIISSFAFAQVVRWEIVIPFLILSFLVSYVRARGELLFTIKMEGRGLMERTERLIGIAILLLLIYVKQRIFIFTLAECGMILMVVALLFTLYQRIRMFLTLE